MENNDTVRARINADIKAEANAVLYDAMRWTRTQDVSQAAEVARRARARRPADWLADQVAAAER